MPAFRRLHPKLRIEFLLTNERTAWLDDGVDVAIASGEEDMDINCGTIVDGHETVQEAGQRIFERILQVASGERTKSEQLDAGSNEFAPWPIGATV